MIRSVIALGRGLGELGLVGAMRDGVAILERKDIYGR